jgi:hypothetical protein
LKILKRRSFQYFAAYWDTLETDRKGLSKDWRALKEFVNNYRRLEKFDNIDDPFDSVYPIENTCKNS